MKRGSTTPVGDIVKAVFEKIECENALTKEDVEGRWKRIAGPSAARHTRPVSVRKTVLTVFVDSSPWMHTMALQKRSLLKQLKSVFGKDKISGIQFRIGEI